MDPTSNLEQQLEIAYQLVSGRPTSTRDPRTVDEVLDDAASLAELVLALDSWLRSDGFLPKPWTNGVNQDQRI